MEGDPVVELGWRPSTPFACLYTKALCEKMLADRRYAMRIAVRDDSLPFGTVRPLSVRRPSGAEIGSAVVHHLYEMSGDTFLFVQRKYLTFEEFWQHSKMWKPPRILGTGVYQILDMPWSLTVTSAVAENLYALGQNLPVVESELACARQQVAVLEDNYRRASVALDLIDTRSW